MYGLNTSSLIPIHSFAAAKAYYERTEPPRGFIKDLYGVLLINRKRGSHNYKLVRKSNRYEESHGESYACHLYNDDVVTYHADGTVMLDASYNTKTTREFARFYLPYYGVAVITIKGRPVIIDDNGYYKADRPVKLVRYEMTWRVDASTAEVATRPLLDKSKAAAARKELRPLMQYIKTMRALGPITHAAWREMRDAEGKCAANMKNMTDESKFLSVVLSCYVNEWYDRDTACCIGKHTEEMLRAIAYKERDCFVEVPLK